MSPKTTFAVGPSKLYPGVPTYYEEAFRLGFPMESHRGKAFMDVFSKAVSGIRRKLRVPEDFAVFFTGSATECWEIVAQAFGSKGAIHFYSGAFGEKWFEYSRALNSKAEGVRFGIDDDTRVLLHHTLPHHDLVAVTINETSNGSAFPAEALKQISEKTGAILAIDATSQMAGINLPWTLGDVWFASVQKCFGLPSGLAVVAISPKAQQLAKSTDSVHYNSLASYLKYAEISQTPFTPNMLGIYALARVLEDMESITIIDGRLKDRSKRIYHWLDTQQVVRPLVLRTENRSETIIAVSVPDGTLNRYYETARTAGFELGRGYGSWKDSTFRIANFPAIEDYQFDALLPVLDSVA